MKTEVEILEKESSGVARTEIKDQLAIARTRGRKEVVRDDSLQRAPSLKERMRSFQQPQSEDVRPPLMRKQGINKKVARVMASKSSDCVVLESVQSRLIVSRPLVNATTTRRAYSNPSIVRNVASQIQTGTREEQPKEGNTSRSTLNHDNKSATEKSHDPTSQVKAASNVAKENGQLAFQSLYENGKECSKAESSVSSDEEEESSGDSTADEPSAPRTVLTSSRSGSLRKNNGSNENTDRVKSLPIRTMSREQIREVDILQKEACGAAQSNIQDQLSIAQTRGRKAPVQDDSLKKAPSLKDRMKAFQ